MASAVPFRHRSPFEATAWRLYVRNVRPLLKTVIAQQRLKLLWDFWGYLPLLRKSTLPIGKRLELVVRMVRVDWNVPHAHKPRELVAVLLAIAERPARDGEAVVEAGCWFGGSTAKLSVFCREFGYELHTYDSFEGVEQRTDIEGTGTDFSGSYAAGLEVVRRTVARYGDISVCHFHQGWFAETLAKSPPRFPVRGAYIDCDLAKGTSEVLSGIAPGLADDGWIFSQDYHIESVRRLLHSDELWQRIGRVMPAITHVYRNLAKLGAPANRAP